MDPIAQIESALPRTNFGEINFRMHIRKLQLVNRALRSSYSDLRFRHAGGVDLQIVGEILKLDRNSHFDFGNRTARNRQPHPDGQGQRNYFEADIVQKHALEKGRHGQSSFPERGLASCLREPWEPICEACCELCCALDDSSSSIKLSSIAPGSVGEGA